MRLLKQQIYNEPWWRTADQFNNRVWNEIKNKVEIRPRHKIWNEILNKLDEIN